MGNTGNEKLSNTVSEISQWVFLIFNLFANSMEY